MRDTDVSQRDDMGVSELSTGHFSWTRPDPTRPGEKLTRPAIADKKFDPTRPDPTHGPTLPLYMYNLQFNNYLLIK